MPGQPSHPLHWLPFGKLLWYLFSSITLPLIAHHYCLTLFIIPHNFHSANYGGTILLSTGKECQKKDWRVHKSKCKAFKVLLLILNAV